MTIGKQLHLAVWRAQCSTLHSRHCIPDPLSEAEETGNALGHAFRAAEIAYDLGFAGSKQRHERIQMMLAHALRIFEARMLDAAAEIQEAAHDRLPLPVYTAMQNMRTEQELGKHATLYSFELVQRIKNDATDHMVKARVASYAALVIRECMVSKEQPT